MSSVIRNLRNVFERETEDISLRSRVVVYCSGCMFAIGWWLIFDVAVVYSSQGDFPHPYHAIGVVATVAFIMIVATPISDDYDGGLFNSPATSRFIIFTGFMIGFSCVIAAVWIMFQDYVKFKGHLSAWPGVALFLQNLLIFSSAVIWKIGRRDNDYLAL
ncbi:transmembrane protein 50A-like [Paramacrobiotus metropolitanus]|uniref:transmembrane protein 50A-like n=1 Tax=Paramacrobiotus metropolitanus TaxID=2943436 RepID=UPI0024460D83|nr:transmembrane protein 50A-like [Paramacrobiotus metropolitanus]